MEALIGKALVKCTRRDIDRFGRWVSQCFNADGKDIGQAMIRAGLAVEFRSFTQVYDADEAWARQEHKGAWAYPFISPYTFRHGSKNKAHP